MAKLDQRHYNWRGYPITPTMMQRDMVEAGIWKCCANCLHYSPATGCGLANPRQHPPANVIIYGCQAWEFDIPF